MARLGRGAAPLAIAMFVVAAFPVANAGMMAGEVNADDGVKACVNCTLPASGPGIGLGYGNAESARQAEGASQGVNAALDGVAAPVGAVHDTSAFVAVDPGQKIHHAARVIVSVPAARDGTDGPVAEVTVAAFGTLALRAGAEVGLPLSAALSDGGRGVHGPAVGGAVRTAASYPGVVLAADPPDPAPASLPVEKSHAPAAAASADPNGLRAASRPEVAPARDAALLAVILAVAAVPALAAALYSRVARDRVLEHGTRAGIHARVIERRAAVASDLARELGVDLTTVTYHLRRLERAGVVRSAKAGRVLVWAPVGSDPDISRLVALRSDVARTLAQHVARAPGMTTTEIARAAGIGVDLAHYHLHRLAARGVLTRREGAGAHWFFSGSASY